MVTTRNIKNDYASGYPLYEFVADTEADIAKLPTQVRAGSLAICVETGELYIADSNGNWSVVA